MAIQIQLRQGTTTEHDSFTGAVGELTYDTQKKQLRVHDGSTVGGKIIDDTTRDVTGQVKQATESLAGKAKIATTAIAQAGVNDSDFITPKKMHEIVSNILGGTPVDVLSSRAGGVTYTNPSSTRYMVIYLAVTMVSGRTTSFEINGVSARTSSSGGAIWLDGGTFIVPPLGTYKFVGNISAVTGWSEA